MRPFAELPELCVFRQPSSGWAWAWRGGQSASPGLGLCLGRGMRRRLGVSKEPQLDRESSRGREDQSEGRGKAGRKGGAVGVGAQLSAKHRRPETSEGAQSVRVWPSTVTQSLRGSAVRRPRHAPRGGSLEPSGSLTQTRGTDLEDVLGEHEGCCHISPVLTQLASFSKQNIPR